MGAVVLRMSLANVSSTRPVPQISEPPRMRTRLGNPPRAGGSRRPARPSALSSARVWIQTHSRLWSLTVSTLGMRSLDVSHLYSFLGDPAFNALIAVPRPKINRPLLVLFSDVPTKLCQFPMAAVTNNLIFSDLKHYQFIILQLCS